MNKPLYLVALLAIAGSLPAQTKSNSKAPACDRQCLAAVLDKYFDSLASHKPSAFPAASNVRFTENAIEMKFGEGIWRRGGPATFRIDAIDPEDGQVASMAVIADGGKEAIELVRLRVEKKKATEIETLIVRPGEGQRSDPDNMPRLKNPFTEPVAPSGRGTREQLVAAAAAYLDALGGGNGTYVPPPFAEEAFRDENGIQATGISRGGRPALSLAQSMKNPPGRGGRGLPPGSGIFGRRYPVVDLERGIVLAIGTMTLHIPPGIADGPPLHANNPRPGGLRLQVLAEYFKVAGGQIHQINAVMYDLDDPKLTQPGWPATR